MSVMEVSHRGKAFMQVAAEAEADLRELMGVPRNYKVLFMQGGASRAIRARALEPDDRPDSAADYINTGHWSARSDRRSAALLHGAASPRDAGGGYCECRRRASSG